MERADEGSYIVIYPFRTSNGSGHYNRSGSREYDIMDEVTPRDYNMTDLLEVIMTVFC